MKKVFVVLMVLIIMGLSACGKESRKEMIETFFGINEDDYEVISVENTLKEDEYNGAYYVELGVEKDQKEKFITEIEEAGFFLVEDSYDYRYVIKNMTDMEYNENVIVYDRLSTVKRKVNDPSEPINIESFVIYEETDSEKYVVYMSYVE